MFNKERGQLTYSLTNKNGANALYTPHIVPHGDLYVPKSEVRKVNERLTRSLHDIKSDRLLLKQEITQEV